MIAQNSSEDVVNVCKKFTAPLIVFLALISFGFSAQTVAQSTWVVEKTFHIGGEGGMDYITVDTANHRLYVPRTTHTMVIDADSGKTLADITGQKHNHGVALVPNAGRGFISDGGGAVEIFDLKTNQVLGTIAAKPDTDGIVFDEGTGLVLFDSGDEGVLMTLKPEVDPKSGTIDPPIELGGKPEYLAADGAGKVYINLEDKDEVVAVDLKARKVIARWPVAPGGSPVGMSMDPKKRRLFIGCQKPQKLIVMSADDGKVLADLPIGSGVDATKFDGKNIFASTREGKLTIASENASGKFEVVQTLMTAVGAKTMDVDSETQKAYLPTAEFEEQKPGSTGRPKSKPGTFMIVVVAAK
jgi:DNA-binding beta-propeller fold protein YncE